MGAEKKRKKSRKKKGKAIPRHSVYVIRLDDEVLKSGRFLKENPQYEDGKPCAYVGMTGLTPEERFAQHKAGIKSGKGFAHKYGKYLMRKQFEHLNPMTFEEAVAQEPELAEKLRAKGWGVWSN